MPLTPVDHDPFAPVKLTPVDHDPFGQPDVMSEGAAQAASTADPSHELSKLGDMFASTAQSYTPLGLLPMLGGGLAGLDELTGRNQDVQGRIQKASDALTYAPRTEEGQRFQDAIQTPWRVLGDVAHGAGAAVQDIGSNPAVANAARVTGNPALVAMSANPEVAATLADTFVQALPFAMGGKKAGEVVHPEPVAPIDPVARATAPAPADLNASEHATPATAAPAPGDAAIASLVSNFKQELSAQPPPVPEPTRPVAPPAEQGRAATPVPPPPPEIAAMLDKLTPEQKQATGLGPLLDKLQQPGAMELPQASGELPKLAPKPHFTGPEVAERLRAAPEASAEVVPEPPEPAARAPIEAVPNEAVEPNVPRETPFTPEERHQQRLDQHLTQLGELTPEQRQTVIDNHGSVELDPVMQLPGRRELVPSIEAAKQQGGGAYGEFDIRGVGNLNSHLGSNSAADPHLRAIADIVNRNLQDAAKQSGGQVVLTRKGGDELGAVAKGVDAETLHAAGLKAKADVDAYVKANGLDKVAPTKIGGEAGVGLHFGVSDIAPTRSVGDIISDADRAVELRKKGKVGYEYARETGTPGIEPSGRQAGGVDGGADAGLRQRSGGRTDAPERAAAEANPAETGDEVALAEPKTEAVKAPPQKPAETTVAEPRDTSVRNAATAVDRATLGLDDIPQAERKGWDQSKAEAAQAMAKDPDYARNLAREVLQSKRAPTDAETMALGAERARLHDAYEAHDDAIIKAMESGDQDAEVKARIAREATAEELDTNHRATQAGGTELARAMAARNAQIAQDYSTPRTLTRARVAYGEKLKPATEQKLRDFTAQLAEKDAKFAELQGHQHKIELDANAKEQARLQKQIDEMEGRLAKRLKACPL